jgi:hypothetical protein
MENWLNWYWLGFALSVIVGSVFYATQYNARDDRKKRKLLLVELVYAFGAVTYGALASGQTWTFRDDGIKIAWGVWALYAASQWAVISAVCVSMTPSRTLRWVGTLLALVQSLCTLFIVVTSSQFVPDHNKGWQALVFFTSMAAIATVALFVFLVTLAMNWWKRWTSQEVAGAADRITFAYSTGIMNRWSLVGLATAVFVTMSVYPILAAAGPAGFQATTDNRLLMYLTLFLGDVLTKFLLLPIVYIVFNPDGINLGGLFAIADKGTLSDNEAQARLYDANVDAPIGNYYEGEPTRVRFTHSTKQHSGKGAAYNPPMLRRKLHYSPAEVDALAVRANPHLRAVPIEAEGDF